MKYLVQNGMEISKWAVGPIDANNCGHIVGISTSYNIYRETPSFHIQSRSPTRFWICAKIKLKLFITCKKAIFAVEDRVII